MLSELQPVRVRDDPEPNDPLSPYYPSELPDLSGNGRKWVAVLLASLFLASTCYGVLALFLSL